MTELRVCIDARLVGGASGGVEQLLIGLASSLGGLTGGEKYLFSALENHDQWLRSYLGRNSEIRLLPGAREDPSWKKWMRSSFPRVLNRWYQLRRHVEAAAWRRSPKLSPIPTAVDLLGSPLNADVVHLPHCGAVQTDLPVVYEPHDLQHVHLPENFTPRARAERERNIKHMLDHGSFVAVASSWVKNDLVNHFSADSRRIYVIPLAPPLAVYRNPTEDELRSLSVRYGLPSEFVFYPAQTWPHKNHKVLLEAASILRARGTRIQLVFSGQLNAWSSSLRLLAKRLGIGDQVTLLGFVPSTDLFGLFRLARCVAIPTLFEAASFPMWEAFLAGTPVAASTATSLPAQAAGAAWHFNPHDAHEVAQVLGELMTSEERRRTLISAGAARVREFSWTRTGQMFRSLYRLAAGRSLSTEERSMLDAPPIL